MKESIGLINKWLEIYLENEKSDDYVIEKVWETAKVRWRWPWGKETVPNVEYRIEVLSQFAATIAIEIERLLEEGRSVNQKQNH